MVWKAYDWNYTVVEKGNEFEKDPLHQYLDKVQKVFEKPK